MRLPACTIDTSCVIALDHLNLIPMLGFLFSTVLLPTRVQEELKKEPRTRKRLRIHLRDLGFLEKCQRYDESSVRLLLIENEKRFYKDRGEAEAIVQAT